MTRFGRRKDGRVYPKRMTIGTSGSENEDRARHGVMSKKTFDELRAKDARRSPTARAIDNKIKAPIDSDGSRWRDQPNRYDIKGIDYPRSQKTPLDELEDAFRKSKYFKLVE